MGKAFMAWMLVASAVAAPAAGPREIVQSAVNRVVVAIQSVDSVADPSPAQRLVREQRRLDVRRVAADLFDFDEISRRALSRHWTARSPEEQVEFVLPEGTRLADSSEASAVTVTAGIGPSVSSRTFVVGVQCEGAGENACLPAIDQLSVTLSGPGGTLSGLSAGAMAPRRILLVAFAGSVAGVMAFYLLARALPNTKDDDGAAAAGFAIIGVGCGLVTLLGAAIGWAAVGRRASRA